MDGFVQGADRMQRTLLPDSLEDYVGEDNQVRVVDVFIDELDLFETGKRIVSGRKPTQDAVQFDFGPC
jgi:hypothetical protein